VWHLPTASRTRRARPGPRAQRQLNIVRAHKDQRWVWRPLSDALTINVNWGPASQAGDLDLAPDDRVAVGAFIAAQLGRAPRFRETLGKFEAEVGQHMLALTAQHYSDER
jgi:hypothetical protein